MALGEEVVKAAESEADRSRLGREAAILRAIAHPGVVRLVRTEGGDPPDRLVLARVGGAEWPTSGDQPAQVTIGRAAAVASILADLHDRGWAHGTVRADHILIDERGR